MNLNTLKRVIGFIALSAFAGNALAADNENLSGVRSYSVYEVGRTVDSLIPQNIGLLFIAR